MRKYAGDSRGEVIFQERSRRSASRAKTLLQSGTERGEPRCTNVVLSHSKDTPVATSSDVVVRNTPIPPMHPTRMWRGCSIERGKEEGGNGSEGGSEGRRKGKEMKGHDQRVVKATCVRMRE